MAKLTKGMVKAMEIDLGCGPHFVALCHRFFFSENARFLLAVIRYQRNPTFNAAFAIYDEFISKEAKSEVNLPAQTSEIIEGYLRGWKGVRDGTTGGKLYGRVYNGGRGTASPTLYDTAFDDILKLVNANQQTPAFRTALDQLVKSFEVERWAQP